MTLFNQVEFRTTMPPYSRYEDGVFLIFDKKLLRQSESLKKWIDRFPIKYGVRAGEKLKAVEEFPHHISQILKKTKNIPKDQLKILSLGGGSVGDFSGFVGSVLKRGVKLEHIPSTWLAALDSAHGGKTALNVGGVKNQIGTIYQPQKVVVVKKLLYLQPSSRQQDAMGELAKIFLISSKYKFQKKEFVLNKKGTQIESFIWKNLPQAIKYKYDVVEKDIYETLKIRQVLNLGHTLGHIFESYYHWSHGKAVGQGLIFSVNWSHKKGYLSYKKSQDILNCMSEVFNIKSRSPQVYKKQKK